MPETRVSIQERRSIRRFQDKPVTDEVLAQVMEAVRWSPSWANTQCWEIVAVRDPNIKEKLRDAVADKSPRNPSLLALVNAPVLIAVCGQRRKSGFYKDTEVTKFGDWMLFDLGLATQNLCLAAYDLGLGTVIVGLLNHDQAAKVLNLPENQEVVVLVPMGYPEHHPAPPARKAVAEFVRQM